MALSEQAMISKINKVLPEANAVPMAEFYGDPSRKGIWLRGSEEFASDGLPIFNAGTIEDALHPTLQAIVDDNGWYGEPYDGGTLMLYEV